MRRLRFTGGARPLSVVVVIAVALASPCLALRPEWTMFGPLVDGGLVVAGTQDEQAGGKCQTRLMAFDSKTGQLRWRQSYISDDRAVTLAKGSSQRLLLTLWKGGVIVLNEGNGKETGHLATGDMNTKLAANDKLIFCSGDVAKSGQTWPAVIAYDGHTLKKVWQYPLEQADWEISGLQADDRRVEARVMQLLSQATSCVGPSGPATGRIAGYFAIDAQSGKLLERRSESSMSWTHRITMQLDHVRELAYGGGDPDGNSLEMTVRPGNTAGWRVGLDGLHDFALVPPVLFVTYGRYEFDRSQGAQPGIILHTRALACLDAVTGKAKWVAGLEPGNPSPPHFLAPWKSPPPPKLTTGVVLRIWWYRHRYLAAPLGGLAVVILLLVAARIYRRKRS